MNNGLKLLLMAAGAIVTCIVVVVGFQLTKSGKNDANMATQQYASMMSEYDEVKLTVYEDTTVSGAEVVDFIKENANVLVDNEFNEIQVKTKLGSQKYTASSATPTPTEGTEVVAKTFKTEDKSKELKEILDTYQKHSTAACYINPTGLFTCNIGRNSNGMIQTIEFVQE